MPTNYEQLLAIIDTMKARHAADQDLSIDVAIESWETLTRTFGALLGPGGVRLIYLRCVDNTRSAFPWLPAPPEHNAAMPTLTLLKTSLQSREYAEAMAASDALLDSFITLLSTLIGARLTIQFLRSAFPNDCPNENPQENPE
jgi:hypothetical protein